MRIAGVVLIVFGFLISLSIVGAFVGIPMIIVGFILVMVGGRRRTVITNVVQVTNAPAPAAGHAHVQGVGFTEEGQPSFPPSGRSEPPMLNANTRSNSPSKY